MVNYIELAEKQKPAKNRAGVEGTIAQAVNAMGTRHNRYRSLARTSLEHIATAAAINIRRIAAWLMGDRSGAHAYRHLRCWLRLYDFANRINIHAYIYAKDIRSSKRLYIYDSFYRILLK